MKYLCLPPSMTNQSNDVPQTHVASLCTSPPFWGIHQYNHQCTQPPYWSTSTPILILGM